MNKNVKNLVFLAVGAVVSLAFLLMPAQIYENMKYFDGGYSNELYNHRLYSVFAMIIVGISWALSAIYYYVINSVKFDRWQHWAIVLVVNVVAATVACWTYNQSTFNELGLSYGETSQMALYHAIFSLVTFVIASYAMRWWSSNCRHSPV